jgi:acyl carrier protein
VSREPLPPSLPAARFEATETALAGVWEEVLGRRPESPADDFFELGGDSLAAVRLLAKIEARWEKTPTPAALFAAPTLSAMAAALARDSESPKRSWLAAVSPKRLRRSQ